MTAVGREGAALARLVAQVRAVTGFDLSGYRTGGLDRRALQRARVVGSPDLDSYADRVAGDPAEAVALRDHLLVPFTAWFRDEQVWRSLREVVLPALARLGDGRVRAWVAGSAAGQEVWSLAACLAEAQESGLLRSWSVLATDVDGSALATLGRARYPAVRLPQPVQGLLAPHLRQEGGTWQVLPSLTEGVRCGRHDVRDRPPAELDGPVELVQCRNVLMYLQDEVQLAVLDGLLAAVRPGGVVVLGRAELPLGRREALVPVDLDARVFRSIAVPLEPRRG